MYTFLARLECSRDTEKKTRHVTSLMLFLWRHLDWLGPTRDVYNIYY